MFFVRVKHFAENFITVDKSIFSTYPLYTLKVQLETVSKQILNVGLIHSIRLVERVQVKGLCPIELAVILVGDTGSFWF